MLNVHNYILYNYTQYVHVADYIFALQSKQYYVGHSGSGSEEDFEGNSINFFTQF